MSACEEIDSRCKDSSERRYYDFDFSDKAEIEDGETLASVDSITASPASGITIGSGTISGAHVYAWIEDGTPGVTYAIECKVTTSGGAELVRKGKLQVT